MKKAKKLSMLILLGIIIFIISGCSNGDTTTSEAVKDNLDGRGPITFVAGKDNPGYIKPLLERWNDMHPDEKITFKELTDSADQQREDMVQNLNSKSANYDVLRVDVVWVAEFAAKRWLVPLEDSMAVKTEGMLESAIDGSTYNDQLVAMPFVSDGGLLYYRKDLIGKAPQTWEQMMDQCSKAKEEGIDCYGAQLDQYEGLTVNFVEQVSNEGGNILNSSAEPDVNTPQALKGLENLVDAVNDGNIDGKVLSWKEEQGRAAFQNGQLMFLRNWPYIYEGLAKTDGSSQVSGKFGVAPLPGVNNETGKSALGGQSLGISSYSKHKATAKDFIEWVAQPEQQKFITNVSAAPPVVTSLYDDPELKEKFPYFSDLKISIENAVPRPVTPYYAAVTKAIQDNAYAALKGDKNSRQAIDDMQKALQTAVKKQ